MLNMGIYSLKIISIEAIKKYLSTRNWHKKKQIDSASIWLNRDDSGERWGLILLEDSEFIDFEDRLREFFLELENFEKRPIAQIVNQINQPSDSKPD